MQERFSWAAYQVAKPAGDARYADWVSRGRRPPTHQDFADYLRHAIRMSESDVFYGRVAKLRIDGDRWTILQDDRVSQRSFAARGFDGVVVTGPGRPRAGSSGPTAHGCLRGESFWSDLASVRKTLARIAGPVVIIGGGGTAAAIAAWFVRHGRRQIVLLNNQATLFTHTSNFFENRIFDDEATWLSLSNDERRSFTLRLNRGVVWESVTDVLADAPQISLVPGRASSIARADRAGATEPDLVVRYSNSLGESRLTAGIVIDASGFDAWWFLRLLPKALRGQLAGRATEQENAMARDLSFPIAGIPKLHAPMHSHVVGPGFMSLMVLGAMADRILVPYVKAAQS